MFSVRVQLLKVAEALVVTYNTPPFCEQKERRGTKKRERKKKRRYANKKKEEANIRMFTAGTCLPTIKTGYHRGQLTCVAEFLESIQVVKMAEPLFLRCNTPPSYEQKEEEGERKEEKKCKAEMKED